MMKRTVEAMCVPPPHREVEEMAEGEAFRAVLDEGGDEWDLREGCSVQSRACAGGI